MSVVALERVISVRNAMAPVMMKMVTPATPVMVRDTRSAAPMAVGVWALARSSASAATGRERSRRR